MPALHIDENSFDKVIGQSLPVLVDFWGAGCRPCQMMGPIVDELADELQGRALVAKVDVYAHGALANRFGITSIPNLKIFKNGVEVGNIVGAVPKSTLLAALEKHF
ncbi:MAG: thioredoxin family protein [Fibrobacter sp.]|jgi:thioredoxin 1|nr:thioredoxin family protein [Fibrobacter sp.]